jgi:gamma-glutamyltranspeptidase/glutathione hydrolase
MMRTRPELIGSFGMVASTHWLASAAGMSVLEQGGNAVDAAVAAGFVMQIVEPHLSGPAGDLSAIVWSADDDRASVICGQGVAPAAASIEHFDSLGLDLVPGSGLLPATVPGAFGGWTIMLERWGSWELAEVLAYALHYAESGFPVLPTTTATIGAVTELFSEHWQPSAEVWLDGGAAPRAGTFWYLPATARTYRRLLEEAVGGSREQRIAASRRAFYQGFVADAVDRFNHSAWRDTSGRDHAGLLTGDDMARWEPGIETPVGVDFAGRYQVLKTGPWGQGPVFLQQLRLFEAGGLLEHEARSVNWIHLITESAKLAFADRDAWYGDPSDADVPLAALLSVEYAAQRAGLIDGQASLELRPGSPDGRRPVLATLPDPSADESGDATSGEPTVGRLGRARGDTCHVDVVDRWGNFVSATPSGGWLQSSPVIPELGFPLGTRGQMFYLQPGLANSLRPGVRPRTTLTPSLALREGKPWLAFGTPGGDQQDQWQAAFFADLVHADRRGTMNLQDAIDAAMFHSTHFPSSFYPRTAHPGQLIVEDRLEDEVISELGRRGHRLLVSGPWTLGRLSAVAKEGTHLRAAANPRGAQGYAVGR